MHIAPAINTTSIILCSNKMQNVDILVVANPGPREKWPLKWRKRERETDRQTERETDTSAQSKQNS